jgi:hypothetical protein
MKQLTIIIDWYGPYSLEGAIKAAKEDGFKDGLYMVIGKTSVIEETISPQYIGLSKLLARRLKGHPVLSSIPEGNIWLGEVVTSEPSGRKKRSIKYSLDYAEWLHAYFMKLSRNNKKRKSHPPQPVTLLNRWWKIDYETPRLKRPHTSWPDLFDYPYKNYPIKMIWFGQYQKIIEPPYIV